MSRLLRHSSVDRRVAGPGDAGAWMALLAATKYQE
jgi:hypothetical protein